jgi:hypothetical protein
MKRRLRKVLEDERGQDRTVPTLLDARPDGRLRAGELRRQPSERGAAATVAVHPLFFIGVPWRSVPRKLTPPEDTHASSHILSFTPIHLHVSMCFCHMSSRQHVLLLNMVRTRSTCA